MKIMDLADDLRHCPECGVCFNKQIVNQTHTCPGCKKSISQGL